MAGHTEGTVLDKFCALRTTKCKDGQEYQKNCDPKPTGWKDEWFWQGSAYEDGSTTTVQKYFEAHHLLCVAAVTECIVGAYGLKTIVRNTEWCINKKINMFAMPLWGHTIKYYCTIENPDFFEADTPYFKSPKKGPKFENIPMHDCDHDLYIDEVKSELKKIARSVKESKKKHEDRSGELSARLNDAAKAFRKKLQDRGNRALSGGGRGTHAAWQQAKEKPSSNWYKPFSMAKSPRKRSFPGIQRKIMARANSYFWATS